ncbi:SPASM domain-containing protein [Candidatus Fermentibacterales bacterium]|nr:SPASM domain-containing protein [Candidatus Fermentibacterales bacterium]
MVRAHSWAGSYARAQRSSPSYNVSAVRESSPRPCSHLWSSMTVCWDGKVVPCCRDLNAELIVGDLNRQTIEEVWRGETLTRLRRLHAQGRHREIDLCEPCSRPFEGSSVLALALRYPFRKLDSLRRALLDAGRRGRGGV